MPDHWGYVFAAYGLAAVVLVAYWRRLLRRDRELTALSRRPPTPPRGTTATTPASTMNQSDLEKRSQPASVSGHPRSKPPSPSPLP